jgi:hypothetical protein
MEPALAEAVAEAKHVDLCLLTAELAGRLAEQEQAAAEAHASGAEQPAAAARAVTAAQARADAAGGRLRQALRYLQLEVEELDGATSPLRVLRRRLALGAEMDALSSNICAALGLGYTRQEGVDQALEAGLAAELEGAVCAALLGYMKRVGVGVGSHGVAEARGGVEAEALINATRGSELLELAAQLEETIVAQEAAKAAGREAAALVGRLAAGRHALIDLRTAASPFRGGGGAGAGGGSGPEHTARLAELEGEAEAVEADLRVARQAEAAALAAFIGLSKALPLAHAVEPPPPWSPPADAPRLVSEARGSQTEPPVLLQGLAAAAAAMESAVLAGGMGELEAALTGDLNELD